MTRQILPIIVNPDGTRTQQMPLADKPPGLYIPAVTRGETAGEVHAAAAMPTSGPDSVVVRDGEGSIPLQDGENTGYATLEALAAEIAARKTVYCDARYGSDDNDGMSPGGAKQTLAAAVAMLSEGGTLRLARGSRWHEQLGTYAAKIPHYCTIDSFGSGERPIIDGSVLAAGVSWTSHNTHANVWVADITFAAPIGTSTSESARWQAGVWDEGDRDDLMQCRMVRFWDGASIEDNLASVAATPGSFTVHLVGSTAPKPNLVTGQTFRFYLHLRDSGNPNTSGRSIYYVDHASGPVALFPGGGRAANIIIQRYGGKDMCGVDQAPNQTATERMDSMLFRDTSCHGIVANGIEFVDCEAIGGPHANVLGGGGLHQYIGSRSRGARWVRCRVEGFGVAYYSHASGEITEEHETIECVDCVAINCRTAVSVKGSDRPIRITRLTAKDVPCVVSVGSGDTVITDTLGVVTGGEAAIKLSGNANSVSIVNSHFVATEAIARAVRNDRNSGPIYVQAVGSSFIGFTTQGHAQRDNQHWILESSCVTLHQRFLSTKDPAWVTLDAKNSVIAHGLMSIDDLVIDGAVVSGCESPTQMQRWRETIADLKYTAGNRSATYSGSGDELAVTYVDTSNFRSIRVVDAYGEGDHYEGTVVSRSAPGSAGTLTVDPPPHTAFTSKPMRYGEYPRLIFSGDDTGSISAAGDQIRPDEVWRYCVGQLLRISHPVVGRPRVLRRVTDISDGIVTLDRPIDWVEGRSVVSVYANISGGNGVELPHVSIANGFPIYLQNVTGMSPGIQIRVADTDVSWSVNPTVGRFNPTASRIDGTTSAAGGNVMPYSGEVNAAMLLAPGDALEIDARVYVEEWSPGGTEFEVWASGHLGDRWAEAKTYLGRS